MFSRTLAAALAALFLAGTAQAQTATIDYKNLDLATAAGKSELDTRIDAAANRICRNQLRTGTRLSLSPNGPEMKKCKAAVRAEVAAKLPRAA